MIACNVPNKIMFKGTVPKGFRFVVARPLDIGFASLKGFKSHELKKTENKFQQCRLARR